MNQNTQATEQLVYAGKWLHFKLLLFKINERQKVYEYAEKPPGYRGGVRVIPIVKYKNKPSTIIIVANFRPPIRKYCLEFPGGLIDKEGEYYENGIRELKEETGYIATLNNHQHKDVITRTDPWKSNEYCYNCFVDIDGDSDLSQNPQQHLEFDENIVVYELTMGKKLAEELIQLQKEKDYEISGQVWLFALGLQFTNL
ncbi:unnamed protein product (macronuclear) [Paramecium tetraurelia]|uniref:Nudix hydrolase domain-containing protein n=1 Tax=Paramecium tetraurelia TaxID=5888 RepID=A0BG39_PARTE|nr:uncharacterized protein GSPATT00028541001 [Paramecium tetraurelia]CAK57506.1 unnamed protein product [Paramecium tetraurelia]|eukprot:XP_001424904.1 hypothetical protein (macronuclear) [Paramecium tetraurelia strain d4-2]